jgi:D-alanyl-D-alanine carboxypeptidase
MTLLLKRCVATVHGLALGVLLLSLAIPDVSLAQTHSTKRAVPPAKTKARAAANPASAPSPWVPNPGISSKDSYLIVDANSGRELLSDRPDELRHPASLTKLMTLYLTFAALDSGRLSLGDALPVSASALNAQPTKMGLAGGMVVVRDAVMGLVTRSANDAAVVLGEALGGDEENFARLMTQKARQLGMTSTVFRNASGLPNREQVTTARDLARLANALLRDFPHYYPVFSVQTYSFRGRPLENHNRMLASYAGADGLKTGYTAASGFNLVMSAMRDNRRLIGVVMGGDTAFQRDRLMAELMDRGFAVAGSLALSPWTPQRMPPSARYGAANFVPGTAIPEAPKHATLVAQATKPPAEPAPPAAQAAPAPVRIASVTPTAAPAPTPADPGQPVLGSWVIQVGSFSDSKSAQLALDRATTALPETARGHSAVTVDEVQMAQKTFHRARLINLTQEEAVLGCKKLEQRKVYCSALQVTAWNTPGAR